MAARVVGYWPVSNDKISLEYKVKRFLEGSLLPTDEAHSFWNGSLSEKQKRALWKEAGSAPLRKLFDGFDEILGHTNGLNRHLLFDQQYYLPDNILAKVD